MDRHNTSLDGSSKRWWFRRAIWIAALAGTFVWAYWPTLLSLVTIWNREADYSHGFLVPPVAVYFLWLRRGSLPASSTGWRWMGLVLIGLSAIVRWAGALLYFDAFDGWSMLLWLAGAVWCVAGYRMLHWSLPSIVFLWFMIPLPFRVEHVASYSLQRIATKLSSWMLLACGEPALTEGNTILLGDHRLQVDEACSGLRIFMGIVAVAVACAIITRRSWWEKALLMFATVPIALGANAARIVVIGLLWRRVSGEAAMTFAHDVSGFLMIPFAALLFVFVLWYTDRLFPKTESVTISTLVSRDQERELSAIA